MTTDWGTFDKWHLVLPPSRPTPLELSRLKTFAQHAQRDSDVCVLGSTPEFRDLFHELGFHRIHVIDKSDVHYRRMSDYRIHSNVETFHHGDWLDLLPQFPNTFCLMVSDLTSGNIPYDKRPAFYEGIAGALRTSGLFIDKVLTNDAPLLDVDMLLLKYDELPFNLRTVNDFNCEILFCSTLLKISDLVDTTLFYGILENRCTSPRLNRFISSCQEITPPRCLWYYGLEWRLLSSEYCKGLTIVAQLDLDMDLPYGGRGKQFVAART